MHYDSDVTRRVAAAAMANEELVPHMIERMLDHTPPPVFNTS